MSVSFVGENRWESTDLGVTPNDLPAYKKTKIGGSFFDISYTVISNICLHHLGDYFFIIFFIGFVSSIHQVFRQFLLYNNNILSSEGIIYNVYNHFHIFLY